jgi:hypothetical protein
MEAYQYNILINPSNLFSSSDEVIKFINIPSTKQDLKCFLNVCEQEELFEYCLLINNKINES